MAPDSQTYLDWSPLRTPGYPAILAIFGIFDPDYSGLPLFQWTVFVLSSALLMHACAVAVPRKWIWAATGFCIVANPFLWRYAMTMVTESFYISFCSIFVALAILAFVRRPSTAWLLTVAGFALAIAILVRPVGYGLLAAALFIPVFWRKQWTSTALRLFLPVAVCLLSVSGYNFVTKGVFSTQMFGGYNVVIQTSFLLTDAPHADDSRIAERVADDLRDVRHTLPSPVHDWRLYFWITNLGYNVAYGHILQAFDEHSPAEGASTSESERTRQINEAGWRIAKGAVSERPWAYAQHVLVHFLAMWTIPVLDTSESYMRIEAALCSEPRRSYFHEECAEPGIVGAYQVPRAVVVVKDIAFTTLLISSLLVIVAFVMARRQTTLFFIACVAALAVNANHGLVALLEPGLPRYAMAAWPLLCIFAAAILIMLLQAAFKPASQTRVFS